MKLGRFAGSVNTISGLAGVAAFALLCGAAHASSLTVNNTTEWSTTEAVSVNLPNLNYYGGVYAGLNTLQVQNGGSTSTYNGFCIDPFHWDLSGPISGYNAVGMTADTKYPLALSQTTATQIEDLWAEFYSPTMSAYNAAGLQIAIWELVSANAVANDGWSSSMAFSLQNPAINFGASNDIASLATYKGPAANLEILSVTSAPGQDMVVQVPTPQSQPPGAVPDAGQTWMFLSAAAGLLLAGKRAVDGQTKQHGKTMQAIPALAD